MIVLNSVVLFLLGFPGLKGSLILERVDHVFTIYFILEAFTKIKTFGWKGYVKNPWNRFDFFLVIISFPSLFELSHLFPDVSFLLVFRLLRLLRILRFLRFIPNIKSMFAGISRAFRASMFVLIVLLIYNVLLAVLSNFLFSHISPDYFGNPLVSLYSIFQIFTIEGWNDITHDLIIGVAESSWMEGFIRFYFVIVVLTGGIFGFSIVNAIFVDEMVRDNNDDLEQKVDELNRKIDLLMREQRKN
ncbi:MAG: ion transporter [Bacteroidota bacterium]